MKQRFGKYEILETLGQGGMGTVYKARQEGLDRLVALKVMRPDAASPEAFARFEREGRILAQLRHPNIVRLLTMGRDEGQVYFTMDYIEGRPLSALIEQAHGVAQPPSAVQDRDHLLRHVAVVARAVHYAHTQGIIHRDLKPTNVIVDSDGQPMITDFGLARELDAGQTVTAPGSAVGTALYMSPEQAEGDRERIGPATDVYALGAILYEVLTGRPPFEGETAAAILYKTTTESPVSPRQLKKRISRDLETICLKCLEKSPRDRYPTAEALAIDLEQHLAGRPIFAPRKHFQRLRRTVRAYPWQLAAVATAALLLVAALVVRRASRAAGSQNSPVGAASQPSEEATRSARRLADVRDRSDPAFEAIIDSYFDPNDVRSIAVSDDEVWWGIRGGAYRLDVESGETIFYPLKGVVSAIAWDRDGNRWFASGAGPVRFDGKRWRTFTGKDGAYEGLKDLVIDRDGRLWFAGPHALSWYDGRTWRRHHIRYFYAPYAPLMAASPDGSFWYTFKTAEGWEILRFDGSAWTRCKKHTGYDISALVADGRGRIWFGTEGGGVTCIDGERWKTYTVKDGLGGNWVTAMAAEENGTVWFGTAERDSNGMASNYNGVSCFDGTQWKAYTKTDGLAGDWVEAIVIDHKNRKWFCTLNGLSCFDGRIWDTYPVRVRALAIEPNDQVWAATRRGVSHFDHGRLQRTYRQTAGLPGAAVYSIAVDSNGDKWVCTFGTCHRGRARRDRVVWERGRRKPLRRPRLDELSHEEGC